MTEEKETEKALTIKDHQEAVLFIVNMASVLRCMPLSRLISAGNIALDLGWVHDPTLWMNKSEALKQDLELLVLGQKLVECINKKRTRDEGV